MATAFNLVDYRTVADPIRRPRLRIVEPAVAVTAERAPAPERKPPERKPMPPSWMIAPPFGSEHSVSVNEPQAAYRPARAPASPAVPVEGPYRSVREVPRAGW